MGIPKDYALCLDVSRYQVNLNYSLLKLNGVEALIAKASQGSRVQDPQRLAHAQGAKQTGMVFGLYHWADPTHSDKGQLDNFLKAAEGIDFAFSAVDVEQYWSDWLEWANGHITKLVSPERISYNARYLLEQIALKTGKPVLLYTRPWFMYEYSPVMLTWINDYKMWYAIYTQNSVDLILTWDKLIESYLPKTENPIFPKWWSNSKEWTCWQWTGDKFILPGAQTSLDINYIQRSFIGNAPPPEPPPAYETVTVNVSALNIRDGVSTYANIIGTTTYGKKLLVEQDVTDPLTGKVWKKIVAYVAGWLTS